jgi:hypothetical protein
VVADVEGLDPALVAERQADEEPQFDQLLGAEVDVGQRWKDFGIDLDRLTNDPD